MATKTKSTKSGSAAAALKTAKAKAAEPMKAPVGSNAEKSLAIAKAALAGAKAAGAGAERIASLETRVASLSEIQEGIASGTLVGKDRFGARLGSARARINACLSAKPKTVAEMARESGLYPDVNWPHFFEYVGKGLIAHGEGGFSLLPDATPPKKGKGKK